MKEKIIFATKIFLILLIFILLYFIYVTIDCTRLYRASIRSEAKPLITVRTIQYETERSIGTKYIGLGYSMEYYTDIARVPDIFGDSNKTVILTQGGGHIFRLFDKIEIWSMHGA